MGRERSPAGESTRDDAAIMDYFPKLPYLIRLVILVMCVLASASVIAPRACFAIICSWRCFRPGAYVKKKKSWRRIIGRDGEKSESQAGIWCMDTASQCHATGDLRLFSGKLNKTKPGSWVSGVSGCALPIHGSGTVQFACFMLEEVYYVPGFTRNLISVSKFLKTFSCYSISFGEAGCYIKEDATNNRICELRSVDGLYELDSVPVALHRIPAAP